METIIILICSFIIHYLFIVAKTYKRTAINGDLWYFVDFKKNKEKRYSYTFCLIHKKQDFILNIYTKDILPIDNFFKTELINLIYLQPFSFENSELNWDLHYPEEEDIKEYTSSVANWERLETIAKQEYHKAIINKDLEKI